MMLALAMFAMSQSGETRPRLSCAALGHELENAEHAELPKWSFARGRLIAQPSFCTGWAVIDMVERWDEPVRGRWYLRRQRMNAFGDLTIDWVDNRRCPVLNEVLAGLNRLSFTVQIGPLPQTARHKAPPAPVALDGTAYRLSIDADQPGGGGAAITASTNSGALAEWAERELPRIDGCWRPSLDP